VAETPKGGSGRNAIEPSYAGGRVEPGGPERAGRKERNLAVFLGGTSALRWTVDGLGCPVAHVTCRMSAWVSLADHVCLSLI
jgi:hypothetical protein